MCNNVKVLVIAPVILRLPDGSRVRRQYSKEFELPFAPLVNDLFHINFDCFTVADYNVDAIVYNIRSTEARSILGPDTFEIHRSSEEFTEDESEDILHSMKDCEWKCTVDTPLAG